MPGLTRKPYKGDRIRFAKFSSGGQVLEDARAPIHTVTRTPEGDDNLCWIVEDGKGDAQPFIWRFRDGLNVLATIEEG